MAKDKPMKIDPNKLKTRDLLMVRVIGGVTKAGTHVDRKKEASRKLARKKVRREDHE